MESWSSSNTDNRLSDNGEMLTKEIMDQQNYQMSNSNGNGKKLRMEFIVENVSFSGDFLPKQRTNSISTTTINGNRSVLIGPLTSNYRTPSANGRLRESTRYSDGERQISSAVNDKSIRTNIFDTKYDNYNKFRSGNDIVTIVLKRDKRVLDFGFSISDRLYGTGVYVNKIRPNGPAELERTLIPCMRIYKVYSRKIKVQ